MGPGAALTAEPGLCVCVCVCERARAVREYVLEYVRMCVCSSATHIYVPAHVHFGVISAQLRKRLQSLL